jgi:hypothetical protein
VAAEDLAAPPAFKADHEIPCIRPVDGDRRFEDHGDFGEFPSSAKDRWTTAIRFGRSLAAMLLWET